MPVEKTHQPLTITKEVQANMIRRALAALFKAGGTGHPKLGTTQ